MSLPIAPRPSESGGDPNHPQSPATLQKTRKISTACGACKQRKTRCTGGSPCDACAARSSDCLYDATSDQRRKIANQRNVQDLAEAQHDLERLRQLTGGIIALIRAADSDSFDQFVRLVRGNLDLSQLAAFVRNEVRANPQIEHSYVNMDLHINGPTDLPSPTVMLSRLQDSQRTSDSGSGASAYNTSNTDPSLSR